MILTIGPGGCGFTFLNWTISYLRGDRAYIDIDGQAQQVDINPLQDSTAHDFHADHFNIENRGNQLSKALDSSIVYMVPASQEDFLWLISLPGKKIVFDNRTHQRDLLARSLITMPSSDHGIQPYLHRLEEKYPSAIVRWAMLDHSRRLIQYYSVDPAASYFLIDYLQMFQDLDAVLPEIFIWLDLTVDSSRWRQWNEIYAQYRQRNQDFVARFAGDSEPRADHAVKKSIFKEIYSWTHGGHPHTNHS